MRHIIFIFCVLFVCTHVYSWGPIGHQVTGYIAEQHLNYGVKRKIRKALGGQTLAEVANYMDFIRSDEKYKHMATWHYATIPDYIDVPLQDSEGSIVTQIERLKGELKTKRFTDGDEALALKLLVHLIGDIHQPLHVGRGTVEEGSTDWGGNKIKVEWFGEPSNLHMVWDSGIIHKQYYSYTEYAQWIDHATREDLKNWKSLHAIEWALESKGYRDQAYETMFNETKLSYSYIWHNLALVNQRLLQAGIRLANVLNDIY